MTIEELKRHCEKTINIYQGTRAYDEHALVLTLIEKQIPKKPLSAKQMWEIDSDVVIGGYGMYTFKDKWCPACHSHLIKDSDGNTYRKGYNVAIYAIGYCSCGQRIDWSEEGESE